MLKTKNKAMPKTFQKRRNSVKQNVFLAATRLQRKLKLAKQKLAMKHCQKEQKHFKENCISSKLNRRRWAWVGCRTSNKILETKNANICFKVKKNDF